VAVGRVAVASGAPAVADCGAEDRALQRWHAQDTRTKAALSLLWLLVLSRPASGWSTTGLLLARVPGQAAPGAAGGVASAKSGLLRRQANRGQKATSQATSSGAEAAAGPTSVGHRANAVRGTRSWIHCDFRQSTLRVRANADKAATHGYFIRFWPTSACCRANAEGVRAPVGL